MVGKRERIWLQRRVRRCEQESCVAAVEDVAKMILTLMLMLMMRQEHLVRSQRECGRWHIWPFRSDGSICSVGCVVP